MDESLLYNYNGFDITVCETILPSTGYPGGVCLKGIYHLEYHIRHEAFLGMTFDSPADCMRALDHFLSVQARKRLLEAPKIRL